MKTIELLDHGYVKCISYAGSDEAIANIAKVSRGADNKEGRPGRDFIKDLLNWKHWTPFEFGVMNFKIKCPVYVMRQLYTYRTRSSIEESMRYITKDNAEIYVEGKDMNGEVVRQVFPDTRDKLETYYATCREMYQELLSDGYPEEYARGVLPMATYTAAYYQMNLRNLFNLFQQRTSAHTQVETKAYAKAMMALTEEAFPITMDIFKVINGID